jgi:hypothetical protein
LLLRIPAQTDNQALNASTPPSSVGSHNAPGAPGQFAESRIAHAFLRPKCPESVDIAKTQLYSLPPVDTSVRCLNRLAATLRPGCGRRCQLARPAALAASSLHSLQGAFEKIHLQCFLSNSLSLCAWIRAAAKRFKSFISLRSLDSRDFSETPKRLGPGTCRKRSGVASASSHKSGPGHLEVPLALATDWARITGTEVMMSFDCSCHTVTS